MRIRAHLAAAAALAVAGLATAAPADAYCAGTERTVILCVQVDLGALPTVDPEGDTFTDCVYYSTGKPCIRVTVPIPTVTPGNGGDPVTVTCTSTSGTC